MIRKFLIAYAFVDATGSGYGNTYATTTSPDASLTEAAIGQWRTLIRDENNFRSVTIFSITKLEG